MVKFSSKKFFYFSIIIFSFLPIITFGLFSVLSNLTSLNSSKIIKLSNIDLDIDDSMLPEIDYDTLNDVWYDSKIEMLIITPNRTDFIDAVKPLRDWKNKKGVKTIILSNFSLYEGVDDAEKIRNMIKSYYENENIQWVLLAGDAQDDLIPIRKVYNPDTIRWSDEINPSQDFGNQYYKPTDFYYADLTGSWDDDIDGIYGEAPQDNSDGLDEISWTPEAYVGRLPASNANELEIMINKTLQYEMNPKIGDWMNRMLLAGGVSDYPYPDDLDGEDEAYLTEYIWKNYVISEMNFTHLHRTTTYFTPEAPPSPNDEGSLTSYKTKFNQGYSTVLFAGHGAYNQLADDGGQIYNSNDANSASNAYMPSLIYVDACTTSPYDYNDNSIGEILIKEDQSGAIGFIGGLRVTWYFADDPNLEMINRANAKLFWKAFFEEKKFQQGKALYDSKVLYINSEYFKRGASSLENDYERKNILSYSLLGDPELDVYTNKPKLAINPFTEQIYGGQLVSTTIKDINGRNVPNARIHLRTLDGKYHTVYADIDGNVKFRVPTHANEVYNITITGHNLIPSYFNFTVLSDNVKPELLGVSYTPKNPSAVKKINFDIELQDNASGIESVILFISNNNFQNYSFYRMSNELHENENNFLFSLDKLKPGDFAYSVIVRDYANNTKMFNSENFKFTIANPIIDYIFTISLILIIGVVGISVFMVYKGIQKYSDIIRKIEDNL